MIRRVVQFGRTAGFEPARRRFKSSPVGLLVLLLLAGCDSCTSPPCTKSPWECCVDRAGLENASYSVKIGTCGYRQQWSSPSPTETPECRECDRINEATARLGCADVKVHVGEPTLMLLDKLAYCLNRRGELTPSVSPFPSPSPTPYGRDVCQRFERACMASINRGPDILPTIPPCLPATRQCFEALPLSTPRGTTPRPTDTPTPAAPTSASTLVSPILSSIFRFGAHGSALLLSNGEILAFDHSLANGAEADVRCYRLDEDCVMRLNRHLQSRYLEGDY